MRQRNKNFAALAGESVKGKLGARPEPASYQHDAGGICGGEMADPEVCPTCGRGKPGRRKGSKNDEKRLTLKNIVGVSTIPAEAAAIALEAIEVAIQRGAIGEANAWQLLFELLPADYLASK